MAPELLSLGDDSFLDLKKSVEERLLQRAVVDGAALGWSGSLAMASTRSILTMYTSSDIAANAFSRAKCHEQRTALKPSLAFYEWLEKSGQQLPWQLRGDVKLEQSELAAFPELPGRSFSVWAGAPGTRTPLHADDVDAVIFQIAGSKRFLLKGRSAVERAVNDGRLPVGVLHRGATEDSCVDGSLEDVHHADDEALVIRLEPGDSLSLPAGLYHDVECGPTASLSLTVRFDAMPAREDTSQADKDMKAQHQQRALLRLAFRKVSLNNNNNKRPDAPPEIGVMKN